MASSTTLHFSYANFSHSLCLSSLSLSLSYYFVPTTDIIAQVFFPESPSGEDDNNSNLLKSFIIFGGAFVMRPIGGLVIGYTGDKHGRKQALTKSLFLMAIPTTCMGFLPTYKQAGWISPVLLCVCRLLQGISVGGQLPASLVYTVEQRDPSTWGYYGSLPMVAANCGSLLGNLCGAFLRQILNEEQLLKFGWRIPFMSGILIAFVAMYLKIHGDDVHTNANVYDSDDSKITNPIRVAFRKENRLALLSTTFAPFLWGGGFYISFVWMAIYMDELLDSPPTSNPVPYAFWVNAMSMFLGMTFMLPLAGFISDKIGRLKLMTFAAIGLGIMGPIVVIIISQGKAFPAFLGQFLLGTLLSFYGGPLCAWLVESFSPEVRLTSASLGYDLAHATVGGFSPAMATALFNNHGITSPGILYPILASISIFGLYLRYCCGGRGSGSGNGESGGGVANDLELQEQQTKPDTGASKDLPEVS